MDRVREIVIIDQDRTPVSADAIRRVAGDVKILRFPRSEAHFELLGHDHPAVLNQGLRRCSGDVISLWDSDAHPFSADWLPVCLELLSSHDAVLAEDRNHSKVSHPCFMVFKRSALSASVTFDDSMFDQSLPWWHRDTGRRVGTLLAAAGKSVAFLEPRRAFGGLWGDVYMNSVYHHGHGSFCHGDKRLQQQVRWQSIYFRRRVFAGRYDLRQAEILELRVRRAWRRRVSPLLARVSKVVTARQAEQY